MKNLFSTLLLLLTIFSFSQEIKKRSITTAQIDAVFAEWDTQDKPGIAVGILNDGEIVHNKGYGLANLEHQVPINPQTRFHIGDIAKEFTVYALLLLEQRSQLSLNDDIRKYVSKLASIPQAISIKQLIHHTSGLNNSEVSKALAGWRSEDVFTKEQAYAMILNQANTLPKSGSIQRHSDAGFMILEDIIAAIANMTYGDFVSKEIFTPLGMTQSVFDTNGAAIANKAQGYFEQNGGFVSSTMNPAQTIVSDLYTTVGDMCLWAKELENPKIGTKQMVKKFNTLSVVNNKNVEEANTALYTGGYRLWNFRGAKKLYHTEVAGGYASKLIRYPQHNLAVVIMGNDGAYNGYAGTSASALYIEDFLTTNSNSLSKINTIKLSRKQLEAFEGDYWDISNYTSRKIHVANDTLRYSRGPGNESALVPLTKSSFKMVTRQDVTVDIDIKSVPKTMTVKVGDNIFKLIEYNDNANWTKDLSIYTGNYYSATLNTTYTLILDEGKLVLTHPRIGHVKLDPKIPNTFSGNQRHFSALEFKRDINGLAEGFLLSTNGVNDLWFKKEAASDENLVKSE